MKRIYKWMLILLALAFLSWLYYLDVLYRPLVDNVSPSITASSQAYLPQKAQNIAQSIAAFAALIASIIALSSADPSKPLMKVVADISANREPIEKIDKLSGEEGKRFEGFSFPLKVHSIDFKITNVSGFTLKKPVVIIKLPESRRPPNTRFTSSILESFEPFQDLPYLSLEGLPFWIDHYAIDFWINMVIDDDRLGPFDIEISISCENADGIIITLKIDPKALLEPHSGEAI